MKLRISFQTEIFFILPIIVMGSLFGCENNNTRQVTVNPGGGGMCAVQGAPAPIPDIAMTPVASGFTAPVHVTHAGDNSGRLFVVEQRGTIGLLVRGSLQNEFFLDIRDRVATGGEMGLLSIAFHPSFHVNGQFYVNYTADPP